MSISRAKGLNRGPRQYEECPSSYRIIVWDNIKINLTELVYQVLDGPVVGFRDEDNESVDCRQCETHAAIAKCLLFTIQQATTAVIWTKLHHSVHLWDRLGAVTWSCTQTWDELTTSWMSRCRPLCTVARVNKGGVAGNSAMPPLYACC